MPYARELSAGEIADFLNRNFDAKARVIEFEAIAATHVYHQGSDSPALEIQFTIPGLIPEYGISYKDDKYGTVIIFPDAKASLHYTATSGAGAAAGTQPTTPAGLPALLPSFPSLTVIAVAIVVVFGLIIVVDRNL